MLAIFAASAGCDRGESAGGSEARATGGVVSLSPAITTTLIDLGVGDEVVGRTPWCRGVDDRPVVGTLEGVDAEVLVAIRPAVVLHQPPATGIDPVLLGLRDRLGFQLAGGRLDGVSNLLTLLDEIERLELAEPSRIEERRAGLRDIAARCRRPFGPDSPGVVALHSVDPVGVAGRDTYLGEIIAAAGFRNLAPSGGWRAWSVETLLGAEPDKILVFSGDDDGTETIAWLEALGWSTPPRIVVVPGADAFEPSTRMPRVLEALERAVANHEGGDRG
ncbi:MAG: hypothetical protein CMJ51_01705 [Planctomycetaceae bacterium]|nr:hypothetical protein [Planctomycetaceae bacterium]